MNSNELNVTLNYASRTEGISGSQPVLTNDLQRAYLKVGLLSTSDELLEIKEKLKSNRGQTFNTNVIRIALNMEEEKIASLIIAYYTVKIDEEMIIRAIKTSQLNFLQ